MHQKSTFNQVQFFPSNLSFKSGKNNHGNTSDVIALICTCLTVQSLFFTTTVLNGVRLCEVANFLTKCSGSLLFVISMMLSGVKWNAGNGKLSGLGCFLAVANLYAFGDALNINDVLNGHINSLHITSLALLIAGIHVFFFPFIITRSFVSSFSSTIPCVCFLFLMISIHGFFLFVIINIFFFIDRILLNL